MNEKYTLNNQQDLIALVDKLSQKGFISFPVEVEIKDITRRSNPQNNIGHKIYERAGDYLYGGDALRAKSESKLFFGVPILRRDSEDYQRVYDQNIRPLNYELKIFLMGGDNSSPNPSPMAITSIMTKKQKSEYIDRLFQHWTEQGVPLGDL